MASSPADVKDDGKEEDGEVRIDMPLPDPDIISNNNLRGMAPVLASQAEANLYRHVPSALRSPLPRFLFDYVGHIIEDIVLAYKGIHRWPRIAHALIIASLIGVGAGLPFIWEGYGTYVTNATTSLFPAFLESFTGNSVIKHMLTAWGGSFVLTKPVNFVLQLVKQKVLTVYFGDDQYYFMESDVQRVLDNISKYEQERNIEHSDKKFDQIRIKVRYVLNWCVTQARDAVANNRQIPTHVQEILDGLLDPSSPLKVWVQYDQEIGAVLEKLDQDDRVLAQMIEELGAPSNVGGGAVQESQELSINPQQSARPNQLSPVSLFDVNHISSDEERFVGSGSTVGRNPLAASQLSQFQGYRSQVCQRYEITPQRTDTTSEDSDKGMSETMKENIRLQLVAARQRVAEKKLEKQKNRPTLKY